VTWSGRGSSSTDCAVRKADGTAWRWQTPMRSGGLRLADGCSGGTASGSSSLAVELPAQLEELGADRCTEKCPSAAPAR
jgi:hypothetical protein